MRKVISNKEFPVGWHQIIASNIIAGEIRTNIEFKIPRYFKRCWGIIITASKTGASANSYIIGTLTLSANSKKSQLGRFPVQVKTIAATTRKYEPLRLDETMLPGMLIQGEYTDKGVAGGSPSGYDLKIYLVGDQDNSNN